MAQLYCSWYVFLLARFKGGYRVFLLLRRVGQMGFWSNSRPRHSLGAGHIVLGTHGHPAEYSLSR